MKKQHPLIKLLLAGCVSPIQEILLENFYFEQSVVSGSKLDFAMQLIQEARVSRCGICGTWDESSDLEDDLGMVICPHVSTWEQQAEWMRLHNFAFEVGPYNTQPDPSGYPKYEIVGCNPNDNSMLCFYENTISKAITILFKWYWTEYQSINN